MSRPLWLLLTITACTGHISPFGDDAVDAHTDAPAPVDADRDGYLSDVDCDDANPMRNPSVPESCDGADDDCDGVIDEASAAFAEGVGPLHPDLDLDGWGDAGVSRWFCVAPDDWTDDGGDCDDADPAVAPNVSEICNGIDDDCDGLPDGRDPEVATFGFAGAVERHPDDDGDQHGATTTRWACSATEAGFTDVADDCDDADATVHPGAVEHCDGRDEDCDLAIDEDGVDPHDWYADHDGDGAGSTASGTTSACTHPPGYAAADDDCDDASAAVHPGATESCAHFDVDADCDGVLAGDDPDGDGSKACADCDEGDAAIHPGATEVYYDGVDQNCDGHSDWDADRDGYDATSATGGLDCDDTAGAIHPGAAEVFDDGIDQDCSGADAQCGANLGHDASCAATSCAAILAADPNATDGSYWLRNKIIPYQTDCDMTLDGGGWTLVAIVSDDGYAEWTWNNRSRWTDVSTLFFGTPSNNHDFRSRAIAELPFRDAMFEHGPSGVWAAYHGIDSGTRSFGAFVGSYGASGTCWGNAVGYTMSAGTLTLGSTATSSLCSTRLYISPKDQAGTTGCSCTDCVHDAYGPTWSAEGDTGCPLNHPGITAGSGSTALWPEAERGTEGFGGAARLNGSADLDDGTNHLRVWVR